MSDAKFRLQAPERLLDRADSSGLTRLLLRSSDSDGPPPDALERALLASSVAVSGVAIAASAAAASGALASKGAGVAGAALGASGTASVGASAVAAGGAAGTSLAWGVGAVGKAVVTWAFAGCVLGAVASGTALELSTGGAWRRPAPESAVVAPKRVAETPKSKALPAVKPAEAPPAAPSEIVTESERELPHVAPRASQPGRAPASASTETQGAAIVAAAPVETDSTRLPLNPDFSKELSLIDAARQQLRAGNSAAALELVQRYRASFPKGQLQPEALAVAVEAELKAGHTAIAHSDGARFLSAYPQHPLSARVRTLLTSP